VVLDEQPVGPDFVFTGPVAKRMTAEQFIDGLWQITGTAPRESHKSVAAILSEGEKQGRESYRASLVGSDLLMRSLGRPNREQVVSDRPATLTTLQALDLSNSPLLAETLTRGNENILKRFQGREPASIVEWLYAAALSRPPTAEERAISIDVLGATPNAQGVEDLLWMVIMLPEFQIVR
jgi:hypothetical protein